MAGTFHIDYSKKPDGAAVMAHDMAILSPGAQADVRQLKAAGTEIFAYLSIVEVAREADYRAEVVGKNIELLGENTAWGTELADTANPAWAGFVVQELARRALEQPFDGFFLDTADSLELLIKERPLRAEAFRAGLVALIRGLKEAYPEKKLILNRGFSIHDEVSSLLDGLLAESLFQTVDPVSKKQASVSESDSRWLLEKLEGAVREGLDVYVVDYVSPDDHGLAQETARRIEERGFHALVTTPELNGRMLAPVSALPRRALVFFGSLQEGEHRIRWPVDSLASRLAQMPMEWLGYELDFLNLAERDLPAALGDSYAAVVVDRFLQIPLYRQIEAAKWLIREKDQGRKILFLGSIPFENPEARQHLFQSFGIGGTGNAQEPCDLRIKTLSKHMNFEAPVRPLRSSFLDLRAPAGSEVLLALESEAGGGREFQPVFVTDWGAVLLEPYLSFTRLDGDIHWLVDPFYVFEKALGTGGRLAPDPTTRNGLRLFFAHIDGDGFRHKSSVEEGKLSSEIVLERVILQYPFPITCSVIESEVRALITDQKPEEEPFLRELACRIFALPQVEIGSHTFSHPFYWDSSDRGVTLYAEQKLKLKPPYQDYELDLEREVKGSVQFINENLAPAGKEVRAFLWSGNCRPPPSAIRLTEMLGIENINGWAGSMISKKHPSLSKVAPRAVPWEGELQVFSAQGNDNIFQQHRHSDWDFQSPFYGGFMHVVDSMQLSEEPRRLTAANIYFHWYSGDNDAALRGLLKAFDWAIRQELHAVTAGEYARLIRDSRDTRLFQKGTNHWIVVNEGAMRTLRLPKGEQVPDLAASRGVTGYNTFKEWIYVHTDGSRRVDLVLSASPKPHLYLVSSTAAIQFERLDAARAEFTVRDWRPATVEIGGAPPGAVVRLRVNGARSELSADAQGRLRLKFPKNATVQLEVS